jgi:hypothetical protein
MLELLQPGGVDVPLMNLTAYLGRQAHRPTTTTTTAAATAPPPPLHPSVADQEGVGVGEREPLTQAARDLRICPCTSRWILLSLRA